MKKVSVEKEKDYTEWLDLMDIPPGMKKSEGGKVPDRALYGIWLKKNAPKKFKDGLMDFIKAHGPRPA